MLASTRRPWAGVVVLRLVAECNIGFEWAESDEFTQIRLLGRLANLGRVFMQFCIGCGGKFVSGVAASLYRVRLQVCIGCGCKFVSGAAAISGKGRVGRRAVVQRGVNSRFETRF